MATIHEQIIAKADAKEAEHLSRFFKTGEGSYSEGDVFLGIRVPVIRAIVKDKWKETSPEQLDQLIRSPYHEERMAGLLTLVQIFSHARKDQSLQQRCVQYYLSITDHVNNWDLVDLSCQEILGMWLLKRDRQILYDLVRDGRTIWEQRIGMVSSARFIRQGEIEDTLNLADIMMAKPAPLHDLLQKATGWMIREAMKKDKERVCQFLEERRHQVPRTTLRYAIEHLSPEERKHFMNKE